ncbi:MAG: trypsin-like peptidase domain-containing protein [Verrucomicrobia bacterium]|nr:trypsin-like peptidase domain-containing protein [Verrucomicrobiota bacterium]
MKSANQLARAGVIAACLAFSTHPSKGDLAGDLAPLTKPDLVAAKQAIANLKETASRQSGAEKVGTERLSTSVRNLFTAEFRVESQIKESEKAEVEATKQDQLSRDWLVPNAFGSVNEVASRAAAVKAKEIREKAAQAVVAAQQNLRLQLQDMDTIVHDYLNTQNFGVVLILADTIKSINERSMPERMFNPSFSEEAIATIRGFIQSRSDWLLTAKNAEEAGNFEEAIRYYAKARDVGGKRRCAAKLAADLEKQDMTGSAIDYYELAGDFQKAAALRKAHPDLRADKFRELGAEDLYAKVSPCCVRVLNGGGLGSGFFFQRGGYILTNRHVVSDKGPITVKLDDGRSFEAKVIAKGGDIDLAIVRIELAEHDTIGFRSVEDVKIGLPVSLIGYPEIDMPTATLNTGRISNTDRIFRNNPVYQLDVSANHGNSGGPVVDQAGHLVGILTFGLNDLDKDRFNFAITGKAAKEFVDKHLK